MSKLTAVEILELKLLGIVSFDSEVLRNKYKDAVEKAKRMEKAETSKFYDFLEMEKKIGISDLKTIERIQWYYNTYFNETSNTKENE